MARRQAKKRKRGFSLKAFLAVVVVLGLLAFCAYRQREVLVPRGRAILTQQIDRLLHRGEQGSPLPAPPAGPPTHDGPAPQGIPVQSSHDNLALGIPGCADTLVDRPGYALGYIEYHEQPAWVVYRMTRQEVLAKAATRGDDFREDPNIPTGSATLDDYRRSGYDRGHLAPAADMAFSVEAMSESFYMSNMSPQLPAFNRGVWKVLEEQVRQFAMDEQDIYIVTGPILPTTKNVTIGANKVTVPPQYYKVVYDRTPPEKMIGFIVPHEPSSKPLQEFAVTVDAVEAATGLDFFSLVPQPRQEILECTLSVKDWGWGK